MVNWVKKYPGYSELRGGVVHSRPSEPLVGAHDGRELVRCLDQTTTPKMPSVWVAMPTTPLATLPIDVSQASHCGDPTVKTPPTT